MKYTALLKSVAQQLGYQVLWSPPQLVNGSINPPPAKRYPGLTCYMVQVRVGPKEYRGFGPTAGSARSFAESQAYLDLYFTLKEGRELERQSAMTLQQNSRSDANAGESVLVESNVPLVPPLRSEHKEVGECGVDGDDELGLNRFARDCLAYFEAVKGSQRDKEEGSHRGMQRVREEGGHRGSHADHSITRSPVSAARSALSSGPPCGHSASEDEGSVDGSCSAEDDSRVERQIEGMSTDSFCQTATLSHPISSSCGSSEVVGCSHTVQSVAYMAQSIGPPNYAVAVFQENEAVKTCDTIAQNADNVPQFDAAVAQEDISDTSADTGSVQSSESAVHDTKAITRDGISSNPIGQLQELMIQGNLSLPTYSSSVEACSGVLVFSCIVQTSRFTGKGCGPTKKAAKKAAAVEVLTEMKNAGIPIKPVPIKTKKSLKACEKEDLPSPLSNSPQPPLLPHPSSQSVAALSPPPFPYQYPPPQRRPLRPRHQCHRASFFRPTFTPGRPVFRPNHPGFIPDCPDFLPPHPVFPPNHPGFHHSRRGVFPNAPHPDTHRPPMSPCSPHQPHTQPARPMSPCSPHQPHTQPARPIGHAPRLPPHQLCNVPSNPSNPTSRMPLCRPHSQPARPVGHNPRLPPNPMFGPYPPPSPPLVPRPNPMLRPYPPPSPPLVPRQNRSHNFMTAPPSIGISGHSAEQLYPDTQDLTSDSDCDSEHSITTSSGLCEVVPLPTGSIVPSLMTTPRDSGISPTEIYSQDSFPCLPVHPLLLMAVQKSKVHSSSAAACNASGNMAGHREKEGDRGEASIITQQTSCLAPGSSDLSDSVQCRVELEDEENSVHKQISRSAEVIRGNERNAADAAKEDKDNGEYEEDGGGGWDEEGQGRDGGWDEEGQGREGEGDWGVEVAGDEEMEMAALPSQGYLPYPIQKLNNYTNPSPCMHARVNY